MNFIKITALLGLVTACSNITPLTPASQPAESQVVFICEHGNVKSLMATNYFNQLARQKGLSVRAISRGTEPDSTTVPLPIIKGLKQDGFDVSNYRPLKINAEELSKAQRVILINAELPETLKKLNSASESWEDVPPASVNFTASSQALKLHIEKLIKEVAITTQK
jgi:arsenate reductase (thioredoxin)